MKKIILKKIIYLLVMLCLPFAGKAQQTQERTFTNPILAEGPDPWMYKHSDGYYYCMVTRGNRLDVWKSRTITGVANSTLKTIWNKPSSGPNSRDIWAPEIHHIQGKWYVYYTATDASNPGDVTRYVFVLENASADPFSGTWTDRGKINTRYPGLDGSVFEHKGSLYFLYSAYVGPQSRLFIAPMSNPYTLAAQEVEIAKPTYSWEKHENREILEGPQWLKGKNGKVFIVYSASACWDDNYSLGMLTATENSDLLNPDSWKKSARPVFSKSVENQVYGPGHNGFTKSPDGTEDWIIYHGKTEANSKCEGRSTRAQKFTWNSDGTPHFGVPVPAGKPIPVPSGEK